VQVNPSNHYLQWGIYMYNPAYNSGHWIVDAYVGGQRVDHKDQWYAPHGSLPPSVARSGAIFRLSATLTVAGRVFYSLPNSCRIP
jgi:hypothetical protein